MGMNRANKERVIENYLKNYNFYRLGIINCQKQLEYITPSLVPTYTSDGAKPCFFIENNTASVAIDRIESAKAKRLREEMNQLTLIVNCIDSALSFLDLKERNFVLLRYFQHKSMQEVMISLELEERSAYRFRRKVLDKLIISLNYLIALK